ncbi:putative subunit A of transcription initiation factor TFIID [Hamiltosporidium magnivora]|uniref:Putative subunit A of transcription initiation factor TFIID n=1 Tax=Hamiltosporidium magnivora TaxID=148818 RepID=A0A4Q9LN20_9MICR|nr:putative subunit A of transcription initiation factor TFIID [Hamiltosporidium magnivora]
MDNDSHFLPKQKILSLNSLIKVNNKIDQDVLNNLQQFSEKFVSDILNRTYLVTKHRQSDVITSNDIMFVVEKEFDYSFGQRTHFPYNSVPSTEHTDRIAEVSKHK